MTLFCFSFYSKKKFGEKKVRNTLQSDTFGKCEMIDPRFKSSDPWKDYSTSCDEFHYFIEEKFMGYIPPLHGLQFGEYAISKKYRAPLYKI